MTTTDAHRTIGGRYRLDRAIGQGGMGTVWQGYDELLGRPVAVKEVRFPPELGTGEEADLRERTLREARATARLSHPNVVTTYDVVEEDGRPWIVMELLAARSLSEVLREDGPLPPHRVAEIGLGVLAALEASHAEGVVHRDVKPSNVLLTRDGRPVLTDYGIATVAGDPALTSTGVVLGSPAYMAPERARGRAFGPESDLWSLGATLFSATEGLPPFEADNALGTLTAVISDPAPSLSAPGPLAEAVAGLLTKDPAGRAGIATTRALLTRAAADRAAAPSTSAAATVALERAGRTQAIPAAGVQHSPSPPDTGPSMTAYAGAGSRRGGLLAVALVVALLLIGTLVTLAVTGNRRDRPVGDAASRPGSTSGSPTPSPSPTESSPPPSPAAATTVATPPADSGVPAGFELYQDPSGFSVAVPQGWAAEQRSDTAVDLVEPGGSRFLRIDQTDEPKDDPAKDWERQEKSVSKDLAGYQGLGITPVDFRGWTAADWEFTFAGDSGTVHVRNRGFVTDDQHGYALYLSTPEEQWGESQSVFQTAADTFTPATSDGDSGD